MKALAFSYCACNLHLFVYCVFTQSVARRLAMLIFSHALE